MTTATVARHTVHAGMPASARPSRPKKVWVSVTVGAFSTIALMVAVGSFLMNANTTAGDKSQLGSQIGSLQQQLAVTNMQLNALRTQLKALRVSTNTGRLQRSVAGLRNSVTGLQGSVGAFEGLVTQFEGSVKSLAVCVPQLQQEVSGLKITTQSKGGWLTGASIESPAVVPSGCTSTPYGPQGSGG